jgi:hypothetical protein
MSTHKEIYSSSKQGKRLALEHLHFALESDRPWYLSCRCYTETGHAAVGYFSNWIHKSNLQEAISAINRASHDIRFYLFND